MRDWLTFILLWREWRLSRLWTVTQALLLVSGVFCYTNIIYCKNYKTLSHTPLRWHQATLRLAALTSRVRSTWTQWLMTTTPASSSDTRIPPVFMWWCGSKPSRRTGRPPPSEPWLNLAFSWRSVIRIRVDVNIVSCMKLIALSLCLSRRQWNLNLDQVSIWETLSGTPVTLMIRCVCCGRIHGMSAGKIKCRTAGICSTARRSDTSGEHAKNIILTWHDAQRLQIGGFKQGDIWVTWFTWERNSKQSLKT